MSWGFTGFYCVSLAFYYIVLSVITFLLGFTVFYWVTPVFTGLYWVLLGFTGFYWVLLGFTGFVPGLKIFR